MTDKEQTQSTEWSIILNGVSKRFFFSSICMLVLAWFNLDSLREDPRSTKWLLTLIFTDVFAYGLGIFYGTRETIRHVAEELQRFLGPEGGEKPGKIGGEDTQDEE